MHNVLREDSFGGCGRRVEHESEGWGIGDRGGDGSETRPLPEEEEKHVLTGFGASLTQDFSDIEASNKVRDNFGDSLTQDFSDIEASNKVRDNFAKTQVQRTTNVQCCSAVYSTLDENCFRKFYNK